MDGMYGLNPTTDCSDKALMSPENMILPSDYQSIISCGAIRPMYGSDELLSAASAISEAASVTPEIQRKEDLSSAIKAKIASHPRYPRLLQAYIDCQKVGAPPEIACLLDEIRRENDVCQIEAYSTCLGVDPELDEFMETYCDMLVKYKSDLARPFEEATTFLNKIEMQLVNLCNGVSITGPSGEGGVSSEEEISGAEVEVQGAQPRSEDHDLKDRLLRKYGGHIGTLKLEFLKKKKKGKLPKEARQTLLDWWSTHHRWPYPTEGDKIELAELTGLDQKQINNWFINQRKRHWKSSDNMPFSMMENLTGSFYKDD